MGGDRLRRRKFQTRQTDHPVRSRCSGPAFQSSFCLTIWNGMNENAELLGLSHLRNVPFPEVNLTARLITPIISRAFFVG